MTMLLGREDVNPNSPGQRGQTPLSNSAQYRYELFLGRDVNPNPSDKYGQTPLSNTARSGHEGVVKLPLERQDLNPNSSDKYGQTALQMLPDLQRGDVNLGLLDKHGKTPLLHGTEAHRIGVVRPLSRRAL